MEKKLLQAEKLNNNKNKRQNEKSQKQKNPVVGKQGLNDK